jgi:hypothetical protein
MPRFYEGPGDPYPGAEKNSRAQAAEKGPSAALARSRGAAAYVLNTPRTSHRSPPCTWAFLSSLTKKWLISSLLVAPIAYVPSVFNVLLKKLAFAQAAQKGPDARRQA